MAKFSKLWLFASLTVTFRASLLDSLRSLRFGFATGWGFIRFAHSEFKIRAFVQKS